MNIQEAIKLAIKREEESFEFYKLLAEKAENESTKTLAHTLAKEEVMHKQALLKLDPDEIKIGRVKQFDLGVSKEVAMTPLDELNELNDFFKLAIQKEQMARDAYTEMANGVEDEKLKDLFNKLADQEQGHEDKIKNEMNKYF